MNPSLVSSALFPFTSPLKLAALACALALVPLRSQDQSPASTSSAPAPDSAPGTNATPAPADSAPADPPIAPKAAEASAFSPLIPDTPLPGPEWTALNASLRGLAGLPCPKSDDIKVSPGTSWEASPEWLNYSSQLDGQWQELELLRLKAMRTWGATHLASLRTQARVLYYPFSGPDFLYADNFFPDSKYIVMAGLEPVGVMPDLAQLQSQGKLDRFLAQLDTSLKTILLASFFRTLDMKVDYSAGLLPAIAVFLGREGYSIDNIDYCYLGKDGILQPRKASEFHNGVQITYWSKDRSDSRVLLYFSTDLGNDGLKSHPGYVKLMGRMAPGVTYLKAASYLLYEDYFSLLRQAILTDSVGVLEDDSGLPLRSFGPDWQLTALGTYTGPIKLFITRYQPDMKALFDQQKPAPLPFGSGYKYRAAESSLLLAEKVLAAH